MGCRSTQRIPRIPTCAYHPALLTEDCHPFPVSLKGLLQCCHGFFSVAQIYIDKVSECAPDNSNQERYKVKVACEISLSATTLELTNVGFCTLEQNIMRISHQETCSADIDSLQ